MKFSLLSDLHLEFASIELSGGDNLLLAGDIFVADYFRRNDGAARGYKKRFNKFIKECAKYKNVYYIAGNHESYHGIYENIHDILRKAFVGTNIKFMENESVDLGEVVLFAGTMWTNFNNRNEYAMYHAERNMNDFHLIKHDKLIDRGNGSALKFLPIDTVDLHNLCIFGLKNALGRYKDRKFLVMTHHAPTFESIADVYRGDLLNHAFVSDLGELILSNPNIKTWVHGHTHNSHDYTLGECRVLCNPRGYTSEGSKSQENKNFDLNFTFEV